jgi:hypothetical protein
MTGLPYEAPQPSSTPRNSHSFSLGIERGIVRTEGRIEIEAFVDHDGSSPDHVDT